MVRLFVPFYIDYHLPEFKDLGKIKDKKRLYSVIKQIEFVKNRYYNKIGRLL
jgi:hypothetical protein